MDEEATIYSTRDIREYRYPGKSFLEGEHGEHLKKPLADHNLDF